MYKKILCLWSLSLAFFSFGFAQTTSDERLTVTTYYPSPYGVYRELRAQRVAIGDNYFNPQAYCWPGGTCTNTINSSADLIVEGNVGVGTSNPSYPLSIYGPQAVLNIDRTGAGQEPGVRMVWSSQANTGGQVRGVVAGGLRFTNYDASAEWMRMTSSGRVGIGTSSPRTTQNGRTLRLDVASNIVTDDVYLSSPRSGSPKWASEAGQVPSGTMCGYYFGSTLMASCQGKNPNCNCALNCSQSGTAITTCYCGGSGPANTSCPDGYHSWCWCHGGGYGTDRNCSCFKDN